MLQALRDKTSGWMAFVILASVSIPFAFFGINNYFSAQNETYVAKVGDVEISPDAFRDRLEQMRQQMRQQQGENFDSGYLEQPTVKRQLLDQMIDEEVLAQAATEAGAAISDARLRAEIAKIPAFQGANGSFDKNQYAILLSREGMSPQSFEERVRRDLSLREIPIQIATTALVSDGEVDRYIVLRDQTRDFRYVMAPRQSPAAEPTEAQIKAWFEAHKDDFMTQEQVMLAYVELDAAAMKVSTQADEETLKSRYEEQKTRFVVPEQRLASHILIKVDPNADAATQKQAQERAAALVAQARAGADFAELAKANSDDVGSKAQGGDLDWIEPGVTQPAFETALFALAAGTVSDPVKSDEGYHVIQLRETRPETVKTFEEARAELETEYLASERERVYSEVSGELIDRIFKDPTELEEAAKDLGLQIRRTAMFGREGGEGIAATPQVVKAAFSDQVLVDGSVSDPIELGPNHIVVVKADEHKARMPKPLEEVRGEIVQRINEDAAHERSDAYAKALAGKLNAGATLEALATEAGAAVETAAGIGRTALNLEGALVAKVFALPRPASDKPTRAAVELRRGNHALVELTAVSDGDPAKVDAADRDRVRAQLVQGKQAAESRALLDGLRAATEVQVAEERM